MSEYNFDSNNISSQLKPGDTIFYLNDYNWEPAIVLAVSKSSVKISVDSIRSFGTLAKIGKRVEIEKIATPDERVCIVWETKKGRNGRGGYRVERECYPDLRVPAKNVARQHYGLGRVNE